MLPFLVMWMKMVKESKKIIDLFILKLCLEHDIELIICDDINSINMGES
jgi:hypothetical protein